MFPCVNFHPSMQPLCSLESLNLEASIHVWSFPSNRPKVATPSCPISFYVASASLITLLSIGYQPQDSEHSYHGPHAAPPLLKMEWASPTGTLLQARPDNPLTHETCLAQKKQCFFFWACKGFSSYPSHINNFSVVSVFISIVLLIANFYTNLCFCQRPRTLSGIKCVSSIAGKWLENQLTN